jgi:hypothetical protein
VAGVGAVIKLVPGIAWLWARDHLGWALGSLAITIALLLSPLTIAPRSDSWIGYNLDRGVQQESVGATPIFVVGQLTHSPPKYEYLHRSWEAVDAKTTSAVLTVTILALIAAIALTARRPGDPWLRAFACLLLVLVASKVLSPQYIAFAAPLAAWLGGRWFRAYLGIAAATMAAFVVGGTGGLWVIAGRNVALLVVAVAAGVTVVRAAMAPADEAGPRSSPSRYTEPPSSAR